MPATDLQCLVFNNLSGNHFSHSNHKAHHSTIERRWLHACASYS